jgi:ubiquinone/menaquinone biosynthesis C-methylase UbiE
MTSHEVHATAATGFDRGAALYDQGRPSYSRDAVEHAIAAAIDRAHAHDDELVLFDVGAGTGKFTAALADALQRAQRSASLTAVEPVRAMRERLEASMGVGRGQGSGGGACAWAPVDVRATGGDAAHLPAADGSVDAVFVAQAFHWFASDAVLRELARVLRPGAPLVLVWNRRDRERAAWVDALHALMVEYDADVPQYHKGAWRAPIDADQARPAPERLFDAMQHAAFDNTRHACTADDVVAYVGSTSYIASLPDEQRHAVFERVRALVAPLGDAFDFPFTTDVFVLRRRQPA